jgi:hypothetical protein
MMQTTVRKDVKYAYSLIRKTLILLNEASKERCGVCFQATEKSTY